MPARGLAQTTANHLSHVRRGKILRETECALRDMGILSALLTTYGASRGVVASGKCVDDVSGNRLNPASIGLDGQIGNLPIQGIA